MLKHRVKMVPSNPNITIYKLDDDRGRRFRSSSCRRIQINGNLRNFYLLLLVVMLQYTSSSCSFLLWCHGLQSKSSFQKRIGLLLSSECHSRHKEPWRSYSLQQQPHPIMVQSDNDHRRICRNHQQPRHQTFTLHSSRRNEDNNNENNSEFEQKMEDARIQILTSRRTTIRNVLKFAENFRNYRISTGDVPQYDPITGENVKKKKDDNKIALSFTAFIVAMSAIALRIGGRTALLSIVGLDFLSESPELKENLNMILSYADDMDVIVKYLSFIMAWTFIKVTCFDAGAIVLALASGIIFGGVVQGAIISAAAATFGSYMAFLLAKLDTPVRTKAIELLDEYPSLRGIEKVVSKDGFKAVVTLRLAPVLPIPIGFYNYIYGITNVPVSAFLSGIFVGSLKPYFLDSYLGYYGKDLIQGNMDPNGLQDFLLVGALGVSVLIGVFASQLATDTWDTVLKEIEEEKNEKKRIALSQNETNIITNDDVDDGIVRQFLGIEIPNWIIGFQLVLKDAQTSITDLIESEYVAKVWNYTDDTTGTIPYEKNPIHFWDSPEMNQFNHGINLTLSLCEGMVLTPILFQKFLQYSDPFYNETLLIDQSQVPPRHVVIVGGADTIRKRQELLNRVDRIRNRVVDQLNQLQ